MRAACVVFLLLAGCVDATDQVEVAIENRSGQEQSYEVVAWWDGEGEPVQWGQATGSIEHGDDEVLFGFPPPCEDDMVGTVAYMGALGNGTSVVWEQQWDESGCAPDRIRLVLEPARVFFNATRG